MGLVVDGRVSREVLSWPSRVSSEHWACCALKARAGGPACARLPLSLRDVLARCHSRVQGALLSPGPRGHPIPAEVHCEPSWKDTCRSLGPRGS